MNGGPCNYEWVTLECEPLYVPTREVLANTRLESGMAMPPSYREWAQRFGYGEFARLINVQVPLGMLHCDSLEGWSAATKVFALNCLDAGLWEFEPDGNEDLVRRLVFFGFSSNGHLFAWDPTDRVGAESAIYAVGSKMLSVRRGGSSLYEFLASCCDARVAHVLGPGYRPLASSFRPMEIRW